MSDKRGFTLIELLVVISIIAILAAILFPVFAEVREKARSITCLSNEKQIGLAVTEYVQDYDEHFAGGADGYGGGSGWAGQLYPYIKSTGVFKCPDDSTPAGTSSPGITGNPSSYALNNNVLTNIKYDGCPGTVNTYTLSVLNAPAMTVMIFEVANSSNYDVSLEDNPIGSPGSTLSDCGGSSAGNGLGQPYYGTPAINGFWATGASTPAIATGYLGGVPASDIEGGYAAYNNQPTGRHQLGSNYVFADGHAKWLRPTAVSPGMNAFNTTDPAYPQGNPNAGPAGANPTAVGTSGLFNGATPVATFSFV